MFGAEGLFTIENGELYFTIFVVIMNVACIILQRYYIKKI